MDLDLSDKLALVTGSTRGIGLAAATGLARMGAEVVVNGRDQAAIDAAIARIGDAVPGARLRSVAANLGTAQGCASLIAAVPKVDILVNNMGIYAPKPYFELEDDDWQEMFDVNVMSGVRLTQHYLKAMLDTMDWGRVVFVSSESAIFIPKEMVHYGFSKAAQLVVARGAAEQTKGTHVTVNSVLPGPTWVDLQPAENGRARRGPGHHARRVQGAHLHRAPAELAAATLCHARGSRQYDLLRLLEGGERHQWRGAAGRGRHRHQPLLSPERRS